MLNIHARSRKGFCGLLGLVLAMTTVLVGQTPVIYARDNAVLGLAQNGSAACKVNGKLVVPIVDATHTYGWAFVANFDHAPSTTNVRTCLAERYYGFPATYTVANHCTVMNNIASPPMQFGNGNASFDGNAYLSCTIPVPQAFPDVFFARVRMIPLAASTGLPGIKSYTFLSSNSATVTAQTDASCLLTSTSQYGLVNPVTFFQFAQSVSTLCGSFVEVGSRVLPTAAHTSEGWYKFDSVFYGPSTSNGRMSLPANYSFNIGATGEPYTLDWLLIDPTPQRSGA